MDSPNGSNNFGKRKEEPRDGRTEKSRGDQYWSSIRQQHACQITSVAERIGLVPGMVFDISQNDPADDQPWDFNVESKARKAEKVIKEQRAILLIGSPVCAAFSQTRALNGVAVGEEKYEEMVKMGTRHVEFCQRLYKMQENNGLYFLHEHPERARSWSHPMLKDLRDIWGAIGVSSDKCQYGVTQFTAEREQAVKKPTGWLTNAPKIAEQLMKKCRYDAGEIIHRHVETVGRCKGVQRKKTAEVYPEQLCKRIIRRLVNQMKVDGRSMQGHCGAMCKVDREELEWDEEDEKFDQEEHWDDMSGKALDARTVKQARKEEIIEIEKHNVWKLVPIATCWAITGKRPIQTKWVDVNKGDEENPEYRSRLVAKEFNNSKKNDIFAATPPLEAKKVLFSMAVMEGISFKRGARQDGMKLEFIDIRRAYFHAKAKRPVFVELRRRHGFVKLRRQSCHGRAPKSSKTTPNSEPNRVATPGYH